MECLQDFIGKLVFQENHVDTTSKDVVDNMEKGFSWFFFEIHPARFLCELLETPDVVFTVYFEKHPTL